MVPSIPDDMVVMSHYWCSLGATFETFDDFRTAMESYLRGSGRKAATISNLRYVSRQHDDRLG